MSAAAFWASKVFGAYVLVCMGLGIRHMLAERRGSFHRWAFADFLWSAVAGFGLALWHGLVIAAALFVVCVAVGSLLVGVA